MDEITKSPNTLCNCACYHRYCHVSRVTVTCVLPCYHLLYLQYGASKLDCGQVAGEERKVDKHLSEEIFCAL